MLEGYRGPIHAMLERVAGENALRFHMPGHKGLVELPDAACDLTELPDTDTLFEPAGAVLQAQESAARRWNAGSSHLLVNGSTAGIQAMILWAAMQGRKLLLPRDCHVSAAYACAIADVQPIWLEPQWNSREQLFQFNFDKINSQMPNEKSALLLTYPDYYGRCLDLSVNYKQLKERDAALLVDSAHGSHFPFSKKLPDDAGEFARMWVSGAHKTLPAPTQTAFLHLKSADDAGDTARILRGITTTSPSWLLLAGLDNSRLIMECCGDRMDELVDGCLALAERLNKLDGLRCWGSGDAAAMGYAAHDPTRLVVDVRGLGMSGQEAGARLRMLGVQAEMSDNYRVVLIATIVDDRERLERLYRAFEELASQRLPVPFRSSLPNPPAAGKTVMKLRQAWLSRAEEVSLKQAIGRVAVEPFGAYPPGIPFCMPGEEVTAEAVEAVEETKKLGGCFFGVREEKILVVSD